MGTRHSRGSGSAEGAAAALAFSCALIARGVGSPIRMQPHSQHERWRIQDAVEEGNEERRRRKDSHQEQLLRARTEPERQASAQAPAEPEPEPERDEPGHGWPDVESSLERRRRRREARQAERAGRAQERRASPAVPTPAGGGGGGQKARRMRPPALEMAAGGSEGEPSEGPSPGTEMFARAAGPNHAQLAQQQCAGRPSDTFPASQLLWWRCSADCSGPKRR